MYKKDSNMKYYIDGYIAALFRILLVVERVRILLGEIDAKSK